METAERLERQAESEISGWNYKSQEGSILPLGLIADEINGLIDGLGGEFRTISIAWMPTM